MIHLVTCANRALYARQIEEMHRLRWKYCIEERGWRELRDLQSEEGVRAPQTPRAPPDRSAWHSGWHVRLTVKKPERRGGSGSRCCQG